MRGCPKLRRPLGAGAAAVACLAAGALAQADQLSHDTTAQPTRSPEQSSETLTLEDAIHLAIEHNLALAAGQARLDAVEAQRDAAAKQWWPQVRLEAGYQRSDNPVQVFGAKLLQESFSAEDFALDALNRPSAFDDWATRLVAEQPLWSGGRIAAAGAAADAAAGAARSQQERARQEIARRTIEGFTGVQLAEEAVRSAESALESASANVGLVQDRFDAGLVVESDLLLARVRRGEVAELLSRARADLDVARAALNLTLGQAQSTPLNLEVMGDDAPPEEQAPDEPTVEALVARALEQRPDLAAARQQGEAASAQARLARAARRPQLGLSASLEAHGGDFFGADGDNATVGLGLRWSLFEGGRRRAHVVQAEAATRAAEQQRELLVQQVELEVRRQAAQLASARQRLGLASEGVALARSSQAIVEDRYRNGLATLVDLLQAESSLTSARMRQVASRRDVALARAALELATGDLGNL